MQQTGDHDRMLGNMLMIGVVELLDEEAARVRVDVDGLLTDWIPWGTRRAGPDADWWAPEPGEQVLVGCPYGDPSQGVVICSIFQDAYPAPANLKTKRRVAFGDGSSVEYDREAHALTVTVGTGSVVVNCKTANVNATESITATTKTATVTASDSLTVDTPKAKFTKDVDVGGTLTAATDVIGGGKSLKSHDHVSAAPGSPTSPPR
ncbi:phage baseplate assembly protein V [Dyella sp. 2RAF44]|uniref:phage baseplate assembly protein V n=1 Tax=Dyella sp. 2RAF44 TaxID=3233000 RepID=UPI003F8F9009